jgi:transcriptional regulator with PAS, ATPase and Fis domain
MDNVLVSNKWLSETDQALFEAFIDNPYECPILIDKGGIVRFMSRYNSKVYGITPAQAIGKHITQLNENTRLPEVLKTGKAQIDIFFLFDNRERIIARIPLRDEWGKIIGAVGKLVLDQPEKIADLYHRMEVLEAQVKHYQAELACLKGGYKVLERIIGKSVAVKEAKQLALRAAATNAPVLITGETGTGKELFAEAIHQNSQRSQGPFIKLNCAAVPEELIESEMFGYESGAFTGANKQGKPGKFQMSHGGTIFLDEIGDMPLTMQAKLLRVVEEHEVMRVGGNRLLKLDFRIIASTNQDLQAMISKGSFRVDLLYRLNVFQIATPSLRDIPEDIPLIANYFLHGYKKEYDRHAIRISDDAMALLNRYPWPGNVRELGNVIESAVNLTEGEQITVNELPDRISEFHKQKGEAINSQGSLHKILMDTEKSTILAALRGADGNKAEAARRLGIHRTGLYQKIKRYQLVV